MAVAGTRPTRVVRRRKLPVPARGARLLRQQHTYLCTQSQRLSRAGEPGPIGRQAGPPHHYQPALLTRLSARLPSVPARPSPRPRREKRHDWELLNDNKAIWLRKPSEVTEEEYQKFYKAVSKVGHRAAWRLHWHRMAIGLALHGDWMGTAW